MMQHSFLLTFKDQCQLKTRAENDHEKNFTFSFCVSSNSISNFLLAKFASIVDTEASSFGLTKQECT